MAHVHRQNLGTFMGHAGPQGLPDEGAESPEAVSPAVQVCPMSYTSMCDVS
jgi:hypothetical protein